MTDSADSELLSLPDMEPIQVSTMPENESLPAMLEKPNDDTALVLNDITNETASDCTESAEDTTTILQDDNEKIDNYDNPEHDEDVVASLDFQPRRSRIQLASPAAASTTKNPRRFSADAAAQAQLHALTRETYTMSLRQLRQERLSWRRDKLELDHLRSLMLHAGSSGGSGTTSSDDGGGGRGGGMGGETIVSTNSQIQSLLADKAHHEEQLEACNDEIETLKEQLHSLQTEHKDLKKELAHTRQELHEERSRHEQEQEQQEEEDVPLEDGHANDSNNKNQRQSQSVRVSMSSMNQAYTARRIQDLEEQIHKWEVLYFESAEMGERQIQRLEEEVEQLREELDQTREANADNNDVNEANAELEKELQEWKNRVKELEEEMRLQKDQLAMQMSASEGQDSKWELQVQSLSKLLLPDDAEPETFADRLAALAEEMNKTESSSSLGINTHDKQTHDGELSTTPEMTQTSQEEPDVPIVTPTISTSQQEPETQIPVIIQEEDSYSEGSSSSSGDGDLEQYVADLEKQIQSNAAETLHLNELLSQERVVAKNREDGLRKQLMEAKDLIVIATNREAILNKELAELKDKAASIEKKHSTLVEDFQTQLQRAHDELTKSQDHVKELRQKLELARQAQVLLSESATNDTSAKASEWEEERVNLKQQIESQQQMLDDAKRRIDATQRENSQLRQVKDSLMGIDREMEELIESLEPLQNELAEQTRQAKEARDEVDFLKQELVREMAKRPEFEHEIKTLKDEIARTKGQLNQVYIDLKNEQAASESEIEEMKMESASLKESLEYYKSSLEIMQEAMHEVNEELRKSSPNAAGILDKPFTLLEKENKRLRADNDKLKNENLELRKSTEANSLGMQTELKSLRQKVVDLEAEMQALEMEASMAIQERDALEERLQTFEEATNDRHERNPLSVSQDINTTLGNLHEIDQLLQEIEEVRIQATQKQEATEQKIRKLEEELQIEKMNGSLVVELKKQIKSLEAEREKASAKVLIEKTTTGDIHNLEDQEVTVVSKDCDADMKDSEQQLHPQETEQSELGQQKSEPPPKLPVRVQGITRTKERTEHDVPAVPKTLPQDLKVQQTRSRPKDFAITPKDSGQECVSQETEQSPTGKLKSEPLPKLRVSVKEIIRTKERTELDVPTVPKMGTQNPDEQQATVVSRDFHNNRKDPEHQLSPPETEQSSLGQPKSPPPKLRVSVKDIIRSKESTERNAPALPNEGTQDLKEQLAIVVSKHLDTDQKDPEKQFPQQETQRSSIRQQKSESPPQLPVSVRDIVRSKETIDDSDPTLPKATTQDLGDQEAPMVSKDVCKGWKDSEHQFIPPETEQSSVGQQKDEILTPQPFNVEAIVRSKKSDKQSVATLPNTSTQDLIDQQATVGQHKAEPLPQLRVSVKDIIRSKESTEQNLSPLPKLKKEQPQRPSISVKDLLQNFQK